MRKVVILGATGSIGTTALRAIKEKKLPLQVVGLVAKTSENEIKELSKEFNCPYFLTKDKDLNQLRDFLSNLSFDIALNGISGIDGFYISDLLIDFKKDIALANKETIVIGNDYIINKAKKNNVKLIPVDSEHSSIYHLINNRDNIERIILTASGGPFLSRLDTSSVTLDEAIAHPTWKMGKKISIDSATLANKGLEVIEAGYLFNFDSSKIDVLIHPTSTVHSLIQMSNGSYFAHMSPPDMTLPIVSAICEENERLDNIVKPLDFTNLNLSFKKVDEKQFPFLPLAYFALEMKGSYPLSYTVANEIAVSYFIDSKIKFSDIYNVCEKVLKNNNFSTSYFNINDIQNEIERVKEITKKVINVF